MREWGIFQPRYLATKLIHQLDKLAGVSIADSAIGRPADCKSRSPKTEGTSGFWHYRPMAESRRFILRDLLYAITDFGGDHRRVQKFLV